ncbi:DUF2726 domain-containing protein [Campylobacter fetus]|uniref:DUF2726 domain-containing protein n=1 Tax=Campylobacter fetus TaxID=196 RepID=UPI0009B81979|nr:DUF2726 domain-containing protein [Campylobacter fetus]EAJ9257431.1 DUF2726 domain-containing protein [Campylobacter fetus]EAK0814787.1 DUF2726 domain-containing protein [Campylobacter fetus]MPB59104.1 DUF2726 domain-containing protein [Campylobacter fetus]
MQESNLISRNLLNNQELNIYKKLVTCKDITNNFIVLSQVPLKAFIENPNEDDMWKIYSDYYVDFLFILKDFKNNKTTPIAILEFNGSGHYGKDKDKRLNVEKNDRIKLEIMKKINVYSFILNGDEIYDESKQIISDKLHNIILEYAITLNKLKSNLL